MYGAHRARDFDWISLDSSGRYSGRWIELRYSASFHSFPVRPQLRFLLKSGAEEIVTLPAPVCGRAFWRGQVPSGATLWIDPGPDMPHHKFRVDDIIELSFAAIAARVAAVPKAGFVGLLQHFSGRRDGARRKLAGVLHDEPLDKYDGWRAARRRRADPAGLDHPSDGMDEAGPLILTGSDGSLEQWIETVESLSAQDCREWRLHLTAQPEIADVLRSAPAIESEPRIKVIRRRQATGANTGSLAYLAINPGDRLTEEAIGVLRWFFASHPQAQWLSFDVDVPAPDRERLPLFHLPRPDGYCGEDIAFRSPPLDQLGVQPDQVVHMPRVLLHRARASAALLSVSGTKRTARDDQPPVDIIIPTRDQAGLLKNCLESILDGTRYGDLRILIADNDSREAATHNLFARMQQDSRVSIHAVPGKFNFAAICNATAAKGAGRVVLFLNNDVEAANEGWLSAMVDLALQPQLGAVGAKLVYPSGTIQHAGMVLGLHGAAGHLYRGAAPDAAGYMSRLRLPHLVSAVTGACLAVERSKFELAGGFDASTFPVEYNDIDLCLRLAERGYRTAWTPDAVLVHAESATRGRPILPGFRRKGDERANFLKRWGAAVANDPFFHPAFSLATEQIRLG